MHPSKLRTICSSHRDTHIPDVITVGGCGGVRVAAVRIVTLDALDTIGREFVLITTRADARGTIQSSAAVHIRLGCYAATFGHSSYL